MKNSTKYLIGAMLVCSPVPVKAQLGGTFGTLHNQDYAVDLFQRTTTNYMTATPLANGGWSNGDVVIGVASRIRPFENDPSIDAMLRRWREMSDQTFLAQIQQEFPNFDGPSSCTEEMALADFFRDFLNEMENFQSGALGVEWGMTIVMSDGSTVVLNDQIYTDGSRSRVSHSIPRGQIPNLVSIVHNHPRQGLEGDDINLENRYPSQDDWIEADNLVALGADPNVLSLTLLDPFGEARIFPYSERDTYVNQSDSDRENGENLPEEVSDAATIGDCVKL